MKHCPKIIICIFLLIGYSCNERNTDYGYSENDTPMVRIAEIEIEPEYLENYLSILKEESEMSVRLEPGVICIYPMYQKDNPTQIRLLEIYTTKEAYLSHLETPHFKHYKSSTLHMVKSLRLVDMQAIDPENMGGLFVKFKDWSK